MLIRETIQKIYSQRALTSYLNIHVKLSNANLHLILAVYCAYSICARGIANKWNSGNKNLSTNRALIKVSTNCYYVTT